MVEKLLEFAKKIEDEKLRKKVIELIKDPTLHHPDFQKYEKVSLEEVKTLFSIGSGAFVEREVVKHTLSVTEACIELARILEKNFGMQFNKDVLIAAALIHDIMKVYEWKKSESGFEPAPIPLDHTSLIVSELYFRNFPEEVIHAVAAHAGNQGTVKPRTFEALLLHYVDSLLSTIEYYYFFSTQPKQGGLPVLVLDEETFKKLKEVE
ncbi:MAG: HDIG domain-containing protein [Candidatus Aenigmarchaeota archaeon]|nr:HDIG domain-containing protein [Candidatus Aenigmarchaeota archaeon]MDW8149305.1 HDIG domain-containing protein [Candidatus Aenigmarchaeota archaeon]